MKKQNKRFVPEFLKVSIMILIVMLWLSLVANAEITVPDATNQFYVNDFANLFTEEQEDEMMQRAVSLAEKSEGIQVVVTTVDSLNGNSIEDYAHTMYNKYEIGREDRGVLILLSKGDRQIRVEVGYGLESYLTDSKAGSFIDRYALNYLKNNQFDKGLLQLQEVLISDLNNHFQSMLPEETAAPTKGHEDLPEVSNTGAGTKEHGYMILIMILVIFSFASVVYGINVTNRIAKYKKWKRKYEHVNDEWKEKFERMNKDWEAKYAQMLENRNAFSYRLSQEESKRENLERQLNKLKERYRRATSLYPTLDSEIDAQIQEEIDKKNRSIASQFDAKFGSLQGLNPSSKIAFSRKWEEAFNQYERLNASQKKYVTVDMRKLHSIYEDSLDKYYQEQAHEYNEKMRTACQGIRRGTESNLPVFQNLYQEYLRMSSAQKYTDDDLVARIRKFVRQGETEREERLAEEERQRNLERERRRREEEERSVMHSFSSSSHSFGSSSSSSSFGGFGGHSGGGGATRGF